MNRSLNLNSFGICSDERRLHLISSGSLTNSVECFVSMEVFTIRALKKVTLPPQDGPHVTALLHSLHCFTSQASDPWREAVECVDDRLSFGARDFTHFSTDRLPHRRLVDVTTQLRIAHPVESAVHIVLYDVAWDLGQISELLMDV